MAAILIRDKQIKTDAFEFGTSAQASAVIVKGGAGALSAALIVEGTAEMKGSLTVVGTLYQQNVAELDSDLTVTDELIVNGNAALGDAITDSHIINGALAVQKGQVTTWWDNSAIPVQKTSIDAANGNIVTEGTLIVAGISTLNETLSVLPTGKVGNNLVVGINDATLGVSTFYTSVVIGTDVFKKDLTVTGNIITLDAAEQHFNGDVAFAGHVTCGDADTDVLTVEGTIVSGHTSGALEINDEVNIVGLVVVDDDVKITTGHSLLIQDTAGIATVIKAEGATGRVGVGTTDLTSLVNLKGNLNSVLTGTVGVVSASAIVTGTGTAFTTELKVGDAIKILTEIFTVSVIASATSLTLDSNYLGDTASLLTAYRDTSLLIISNGDAENRFEITKSGDVGIVGDVTIESSKDLVFTDVSAVEQVRIDGATGNITTNGTVDSVDIDLASNFVFNEVTSTVPNGTEVTFAVANTYLTGKLSVFLNGQWLRPGADNDYTEGASLNTVVFVTAPLIGDVISYIYVKNMG